LNRREFLLAAGAVVVAPGAVVVVVGSWVATATAAPAPAAAADPLPPPAVPASPEGTVIASPSVGLFWRAPSPTAPPFVEVGARVEAGDTIAIVEVMKLMNYVVSPVAGTVVAIEAENGAMVEFGQTLVVVAAEE
jgi:acetyl-CoA carboxylase biotin carboxyl carrier protein